MYFMLFFNFYKYSEIMQFGKDMFYLINADEF